MHIKQGVKEFLQWKKTHAKTAVQAYRPTVDHFALFTNKDSYDITFDDIAMWQHLLEIKYSSATVAYRVSIIKNLFGYLHGLRLSSVNPFMIRIPKFISKRMPVVTKVDLSMLVLQTNEWEFYSLRKRLVYLMLWDTGVRVSELCDINMSDIDKENCCAQIITKKNGQMRWIFWSKETNNFLIRYLGTRICLNSKEWLFVSKSNKRLNPRDIQRWITDARGSSEITPHSFRHAKAHEMLRKGANIKEIGLVLGHSEKNAQSALQYLRLDVFEANEIAKKYL